MRALFFLITCAALVLSVHDFVRGKSICTVDVFRTNTQTHTRGCRLCFQARLSLILVVSLAIGIFASPSSHTIEDGGDSFTCGCSSNPTPEPTEPLLKPTSEPVATPEPVAPTPEPVSTTPEQVNPTLNPYLPHRNPYLPRHNQPYLPRASCT